jgi:hypothetical protein
MEIEAVSLSENAIKSIGHNEGNAPCTHMTESCVGTRACLYA